MWHSGSASGAAGPCGLGGGLGAGAGVGLQQAAPDTGEEKLEGRKRKGR